MRTRFGRNRVGLSPVLTDPGCRNARHIAQFNDIPNLSDQPVAPVLLTSRRRLPHFIRFDLYSTAPFDYEHVSTYLVEDSAILYTCTIYVQNVYGSDMETCHNYRRRAITVDSCETVQNTKRKAKN